MVALPAGCPSGGQRHPNQSMSLVCPVSRTDTPIHIPAFTGTSYLMLEPLASFLQPQGSSGEPPGPGRDGAVGLYLTLKTRATQGTVLYSEWAALVVYTTHGTTPMELILLSSPQTLLSRRDLLK